MATKKTNTKAKAKAAPKKAAPAKKKKAPIKKVATKKTTVKKAAGPADPMGCCTWTNASGQIRRQNMRKSQCTFSGAILRQAWIVSN